VWRDVLGMLPVALRNTLYAVTEDVEEIRLRANKPIELVRTEGQYAFIGPPIDRDDVQHTLERMAQFSLYSVEEQLRRGFLTMPQGHRVGWVGQVTVEDGVVRTFRSVAGCCIRIAKPFVGIADRLCAHIDGHTLIVSPPQCGKTTLLRDIARVLAQSAKVGIVDERSEIAACVHGVPSFDVGVRTDVLDRCPKATGMMMLIRSMSPDVLIVDELGGDADAMAVREAMHAGVRVIASAHGHSVHDVQTRLHGLLCQQYVVLDRARYASITNAQGQHIAHVSLRI
jgi:stage III sporulation protein AA